MGECSYVSPTIWGWSPLTSGHHIEDDPKGETIFGWWLKSATITGGDHIHGQPYHFNYYYKATTINETIIVGVYIVYKDTHFVQLICYSTSIIFAMQKLIYKHDLDCAKENKIKMDT